MNRPNTLILSAGLVLSPVLLTAAEWVRLTVDNAYVEIESDSVADAASHLQAVADRLAWWHAAAYLDLAYIAAWALALLAIAVVVGRTRPVLAALSGLLGLISTLGLAMHWAFYYIPLGSLAQEADRDLAARAASASGDDRLLAIALLMFLLGTLLAVVGAGVGLWRAHALPWWAALGLLIWLGYVVAGMEARPAALLNLALLLPFLAVARRLAPGKEPVAEREPTPA
ncbi:MAG TPA: hypothetical protein VFB74_16155 [Kribbellaceae bacterium]|nr:hypothetical protein [Kribbellaceae bacterium]